MGFDFIGLVAVRRGRFDHIRVNRALHQEFWLANGFGLALEDADELLADDFALFLRLGDTCQSGKILIGGLDGHQFDAEHVAEGFHDLRALILAQQAGIDKNGHQLVADGFVHQRRRHRRIDSARNGCQHPRPANLLTYPRHRLIDNRLRRPIWDDSGDVGHKAADDFTAANGMVDFRVELQAIVAARGVGHGGEGAVAALCQGAETRRQFGQLVAVRHPDLEGIAAQQRIPGQRLNNGVTVLTVGRGIDLAAQGVGQGLHPVANAQNRQSACENEILNKGRARRIDRVWPA